MTTQPDRCEHGTHFVDDCAQCEDESFILLHEDDPETIAAYRRLQAFAGGQGRTAASVRSSGVWAGLAILALSAGTVLLFLLRWLKGAM